jgi:glycolate oxidase FAD binding subunit
MTDTKTATPRERSEADIAFRPASEDDVKRTVTWAAGEKTPLEILGHGTKRAIGRAVQAAHTLDLSDLSGVNFYEPDELVLSARAGTPRAELEELLAGSNQQFEFEPIDYGPLLGGEPGRGTLGGMLSANLAGPRRLKAGAARDHVLGVRCVTGRGEVVKSGGRVVKNVTGYDLSKGLAGAWGTLAVLTEITMKVLPRPQTEATLIVSGLNDAEAAEAMAAAMGSSGEVAGAAHLPESVRGKFLSGDLPRGPATVMRLEGFAPSVAYRLERLAGLMASHGATERLEAAQSETLWREIRDVRPFCDGTQRAVWRVSVAPSDGHRLMAALRLQTGVDGYYDWQGGLVWLRMEAACEADLVRRTIRALGGGHATLVRADAATRASVPIFEPQPGPLAALSARLKDQFDPQGILNPRRMG